MVKDRLARIDPAQASEAQQAVIARLGEGRRRIPTPFHIWLHSPEMAEGMEIIGTRIDAAPLLTKAESEVAILSTAAFWKVPYVIANHRRKALASGLPEVLVEAILARHRPEGVAGRLGLVCGAVWAILEGGEVSAAEFARYDAELGRAVLAELLVVIGYFTSVSLAMNLHALEPKA